MADIDHVWGQDLKVSPSGDLAIVDGTQRGIERVIRRLMTAGDRVDAYGTKQPGEYIYHPDYGASIPQRIGNVADLNLLTALIRSQIFKEDAVAKTPQPVITLTPFLGGVSIAIKYADARTGTQSFFSFDVSK